ncbi:putative reverse transcriptase zinc-binding domain-containing protein [Helianthus annuus]|nr:putative reverse transcriptase zinc-binding domain-containing protein [Helianthus annuus]
MGNLNEIKNGGMGIGGVHGFNLAMLSKWWSRFKASLNQLWVKVVVAIHFNNVSNNLSKLIPLKNPLRGFGRMLGSVESNLAKFGIILKDNLVAEGASWKWRLDPNGSFSVKQFWLDLELAAGGDANDVVSYHWNSWATPNANYLLWRALTGKIVSKVGLFNRGVPLANSSCSRCGRDGEDLDHIFVNCLWTRCIWWNILTWMRISFPAEISNLRDLVSFIKNWPGGRI